MENRKKISQQTGDFIACYEMYCNLWDKMYSALKDYYGDKKADELMDNGEIGNTFDALKDGIGSYILESINDNIGILSNIDTI